MNTLAELITEFKELGDLEKDRFKSLAYKRATLILNSLSEEDYKDLDNFTHLEGIGTSINQKILEFRNTGKISKLENYRQSNESDYNPKYYKIRKSFITKKITYNQAQKLLYKLYFLGPNINFIVCGSYRRESELIGDLDIIISQKHYLNFVTLLALNYTSLSIGNTKSSFMIDPINKVPLDVYTCPDEELLFMELYLIGSKEFNIKLRGIAKSQGYLLNEKGLFNVESSTRILIDSEKALFDFLNTPYVEPKFR